MTVLGLRVVEILDLEPAVVGVWTLLRFYYDTFEIVLTDELESGLLSPMQIAYHAQCVLKNWCEDM
jgi:hypothetical protein